jgi:hypothetical protein
MPFDGLDPAPRPDREPDWSWSARDRVVAAAIALLLAVITIGECRMLLGYWQGLGHES